MLADRIRGGTSVMIMPEGTRSPTPDVLPFKIGHLEAMRDYISDCQLAVVPGTSHRLPLEKPELTARLILDFLADEQPAKMMPTPQHSRGRTTAEQTTTPLRTN